MSERNKL